MPLPHDGNVKLFRIVDADGNPARVSSIAGVFRLAVDALLAGGAGAFAQGDFDSAAADETNALAIWARAAVTGRDGSAAAGSRNVPVEARNFDTKGDIISTTVGMNTNSRMGLFVTGDDWRMAGGVADPFNSNFAFAKEVPARDNGWEASDGGRRFAVTNQTPGGTVTAASATFDATKPTFMIRGAVSIEIILRSLKLIVTSSLTARIVIAIDTADRFSAGGSSITPQNMNADSSVAFPGTSFLVNPTATAAGGGTRYLFNDRVISAPASGEWQSADAWKIKGTRTILVYVYDAAGTVAPVVEHNWDLEAF